MPSSSATSSSKRPPLPKPSLHRHRRLRCFARVLTDAQRRVDLRGIEGLRAEEIFSALGELVRRGYREFGLRNHRWEVDVVGQLDAMRVLGGRRRTSSVWSSTAAAP